MKRDGPGVFYGVGVGPGDPELLTRKAMRVLEEVDWIYHPRSANASGAFARRIVGSLGLPEEKFRGIALCMNRQRDADLSAYAQAARSIGEEVERGQSVAWITEGDPLFYSTFIHVYEALRGLYPTLRAEIVPGVTSVQAAAARARMPLANLDEKVAVIPAIYGLSNVSSLLNEFATVAILKVHSALDSLQQVVAEQPDIKAVYLEKVGTPEERVSENLHELCEQDLPYFSLVLLRKVSAGPRSETKA